MTTSSTTATTGVATESPVRYIVTSVEHTIVFNRSNGEQVNFALQHFAGRQEMDISVLSCDPDEPIMLDRVLLDYKEARLLRDLLNRPEVSAILDQD